MTDVLSTLIRSVPNLDVPCIENGRYFHQCHKERVGLRQLRHQCLRLFPELGYSNMTEASDLSELAVRLNLLPRDKFTDETWESITRFTEWCTSHFPPELYIVRQRVSTPDEVRIKHQLSGPRAWFDIVGFQIIPRSVEQFARMVRMLNEQGERDELFVLNTFPFTSADFRRFIGPNSSPYYRAIHYHLNLGRVCAEVQVRMPIADQWSLLHHVTCYKPILPITLKEKRAVLAFGRVANWVDFYQLSTTTK